ncbi:MAG: butyrate kinase [Negativicutes bacterium]|nr:butyrate kinase [Negativicutes bacterium]
MKILAINPGSTSTKIAIYENGQEIFSRSINHSAEELARFANIVEQFPFRYDEVCRVLEEEGVELGGLAAISARGGLLRPMVSGTYLVSERMKEDLISCRYGAHAANLGALIADRLARSAGCPAFIVDPVVVDELAPVARITGLPQFERRSIFHALNQKAVAKRFAKQAGRNYKDLRLIVVHLGGGISIGSHLGGRVVEVENALDGEGPFTPERTGTVQAMQFISYVIDNKLSKDQVRAILAGRGGLVAHLGTNDVRMVEQMINDGNERARLVFEAMVYNISKYVAFGAIPFKGKVDNIILTGGIAHSRMLTDMLTDYVSWIAPVVIMPGENELQALVEGAMRVLEGQEQAREYI